MPGLQLVQSLKLSQQLVMTPQLQMAIKLLQLSQIELVDKVQQELNENPVLEEGLESPNPSAESNGQPWEQASPTSQQEESHLQKLERKDRKESQKEGEVKGGEEVDWESYMENHANQPPASSFRADSEELPSLDATLTRKTSLFDHLLWQIRMNNFVENEQRFALLVIGNLDNRGYLADEFSLEEMAEEAGLNPEDAEEVLMMIQELDPIGVGSRDLRECLLAQVRVLKLDEDVEAIIDRHLVNLEKRNYQGIIKDLKISLKDVYDAAKIISGLEPNPGRDLSTEDTKYIVPDVYVHKLGDKYFVVPNDDGMPKLKISGYYKSAFSGDKETKEYVKGKLRSAQWLIRSIDQRRRTIIKVTECIVEKQFEFFEKGIDKLKPMVLHDVAQSIGMHESTISRVTNNKYVHTPRGIFELKYFFNPGIRRSKGGKSVANESVKQAIKQIIDQENKKKPLSDQKIVEALAKDEIVIARRTVAKYREMLGVFSSSRRRQDY